MLKVAGENLKSNLTRSTGEDLAFEYNLLYLHYDPEKRPTIQQAIANIQSLFSENDLYENKYLHELMKLYINKIDIMNII